MTRLHQGRSESTAAIAGPSYRLDQVDRRGESPEDALNASPYVYVIWKDRQGGENPKKER